ncbi:MAG: YbaN family protein [Candidatus Thiodiazotropha sp. (ex Monitilora ramsayi)]|nr:YbaN family protein [Candidatus Thiodiazotropha sp. (ex Monitilora ramsayi)]
MTKENQQPDQQTNRTWKIAAGWLLFAVGVVGIVLPVLPTTIFWIGAVWFWSRSSPHLTERILSHPQFGRPVLNFIERGEIARQGKLMASAGMILGYLLMHLMANPAWPTGLAVGLTLIAVAIWLWFRPEPESDVSSAVDDRQSRLTVSAETSAKPNPGSVSD